MTEPADGLPRRGFAASLRTARSAAVAGLIFSIVMVLVVLLFRSAFPPDLFMESTAPPTPDALNRGRWALLLLPYAGIAFIWFMAALNYNLGHADHRLFTTVFLTSGSVFVALVFVAGAVGSAELAALEAGQGLSGPERLITGVTVNELLVNYTSRMAAVFCLSIATFGRLRKLLPLWLTLLGTLTGLFLLLVPFGVRHIELVFPAWITILSLYLFIKDPGGQPRTQPQTQA